MASTHTRAHPDTAAPVAATTALTDRPRRPLNARYETSAGNDVALGHADRPTWRGLVHAIGLIAAAPAMVALAVNTAGDVRTRISVAVYAVGLCSMLAVSATYHRWVHGLRARCAWRRADHATILAATAGSSTPIVLAVLPGAAGPALIGAVWSTALIGAGFKLSRWNRGDRAGTVIYVATIALAATATPWIWTRQGAVPAALVIAGGLVYIIGAGCFAKTWPTLRPTVFSYHEVWHIFTIAAALTQFAAIWIIAT